MTPRPGTSLRALNKRMSNPHPCENCSALLPPSSLRFCDTCRDKLAHQPDRNTAA